MLMASSARMTSCSSHANPSWKPRKLGMPSRASEGVFIDASNTGRKRTDEKQNEDVASKHVE